MGAHRERKAAGEPSVRYRKPPDRPPDNGAMRFVSVAV
jgi:hypothetical protein